MADIANIFNKRSDVITDIKERVGEFKLYFEGEIPQPITITIWKDAEGQMSPVPSHIPEFKDGGGPYYPTFTSWTTVEEALDEIFKSGFPFTSHQIIRWVELETYLATKD